MVRDPTTWTILQQDGPNHLGLLYNALPEHQIALNHLGLCARQVTAIIDGTGSLGACITGVALTWMHTTIGWNGPSASTDTTRPRPRTHAHSLCG